MTMNESSINTLVRYAGRELTLQILAVAQRELGGNQWLEKSEAAELEMVKQVCEAWLAE
jgi:hypothetical protein